MGSQREVNSQRSWRVALNRLAIPPAIFGAFLGSI